MVVSSFGQTCQQILRRLHRPARRRKHRAGRSDRPPVLEALETRVVPAGTWTRLARPAPSSIGTMTLLSDGTVMAQGGGTVNTWYRLTPDSSGSYVNGTWSALASMRYTRLYYGSNLLPDGRLFLVGGEYSSAGSSTRTGEIYDPVTNRWADIANFPQNNFGDDPTELLPDGRVLAGYITGPQTYIYNPATNQWTATGSKLRNDRSDEETWLKLADDSILSYDVFNNGHAQRYVPSSGTWVDAGNVPVNLSSSSVGFELGPAFRLPDGRAWFIGANGNTAFYNPSSNSWTAGPVVPNSLGADDAPGAIMPNGHVLLAVDHFSPLFTGPTSIFEYDPAANTYTNVTPAGGVIDLSGPAYVSRMLMLPSGQVLMTGGGNQLAVWTPTGNPDDTWKPTISGITNNGDGTFTLSGTQLNGISEGASYGDDAEMYTNYPIVQISDTSGHVYYARSFNWSSTGVATGAAPVTTQFTPPAGLVGGTYDVRVVANGIASDAFPYTFAGVTHFSVTADTDTTVAGTAIRLTVQALDDGENVVPGYRGTVHFTGDDPQASLPANYTFTAADQGVHTFTVTLRTAGDDSVTVTDTASSAITGQTTVTVTPAAATWFYVATNAADPVVAGTPFDVAVYAVDPYGNVDTNYQGTVTFSSADPYGASLPADYTFQPQDQGVAYFAGGATLYTAGTWDVTATDVDSGITSAATVNVQAAPASGFYVLAPASTPSGTAFDVTVYAVDPYGNVDTNYQGTITWATMDGDAGVVLPADYTFQPQDQGVATFAGGVTLVTPGDQLLTATDVDSGITGNATVTVTAGPLPNPGHHRHAQPPAITPAVARLAPVAPASNSPNGTAGTPASLERAGLDRFFAAGQDAAMGPGGCGGTRGRTTSPS